jgi:hypothetical protein
MGRQRWQDANGYRHGLKQALALFGNEAMDAPDCCELMAAAPETGSLMMRISG